MKTVDDKQYRTDKNYKKNLENQMKQYYIILDNMLWDRLRNEIILFFEENKQDLDIIKLESIDISFSIISIHIGEPIKHIHFNTKEKIPTKNIISEDRAGLKIEECFENALYCFQPSCFSDIVRKQHNISIPYNNYEKTINQYFDQYFDIEYSSLKEQHSINKNTNSDNKKIKSPSL